MKFTMKSWACAGGAAVKPVAVAIVATAMRGGSLLVDELALGASLRDRSQTGGATSELHNLLLICH